MTRQKRWLCLVIVLAVACAYQWIPVHLRCAAATSRPVYLTGQQVRLKVTLRNADVRFPIVMTPVDGSEVGWRYPHVSFEVRKDGELLDRVYGRCGNLNAVTQQHFVRLYPGGQCSFTMPLLGYALMPGRYRVRVHYVLGRGEPLRSPKPLTESEQKLMRRVNPCDLWTAFVTFTVRKPTLDELNRLVRTLEQGNPSSVYEAYDVLRAARDVRTVEPLSRLALSNSAAREFAVLILSVINDPRAAQTVERALEQGMESLTTYRVLNELRRHAPDAARRASRRLLRTSFSDFALRESADILCDTMGVRAAVEEVLKRYQTAERQHAHPPSQYAAGTLRYWLKMRFCPQNDTPPRTSSEWRAWLRRRGVI